MISYYICTYFKTVLEHILFCSFLLFLLSPSFLSVHFLPLPFSLHFSFPILSDTFLLTIWSSLPFIKQVFVGNSHKGHKIKEQNCLIKRKDNCIVLRVENSDQFYSLQKYICYWEFPGSPVVGAWCFHCQASASVSGKGTKISRAARCGQKKKHQPKTFKIYLCYLYLSKIM